MNDHKTTAPMNLLNIPAFKKSVAQHRKNASPPSSDRVRLSKEGYSKALRFVGSNVDK